MKLYIISKKSFYLLLILLISVFNANAQPAGKQPVFVLVHGAFHGGWCWQRVSKELRAKGALVYTPTLAGLAEHKNTLNDKIDLNTHIDDIVNFIIEEDLHNVILVGHSYAGAVIAGVADRIPERLSKLVFLDAMLMENGQSALDVSPDDIRAYFVKATNDYDKGLSIPFFTSDFFGVTNTADIKWVNDRLTNQPFKTFSQPLILKHAYGNHLPLVYIACTQPELRAIKPFADKTKSSNDWKYLELKTGHDAMITMPVELSNMLQSLN
ncbi:Alpha/beta hydrolase family protein [Mucilaginibacter lappiensis]|uniref:Pimeloyl-ACP methyl ester carboxylesterase n=1 Tax=Mucilaginibacter lappiensis TaxID=354630 RepID=A0ABR6PN63_9SPHI|nr:alpha/beta hydrolase family protein [Mucilaginibacter lappiensis]MBB6111203.1 pimeloyl-ACP methyl ester carboxylesterase [Mucilaginibacter lappiensis]SIR72874.1 Alpha/beta hydrolase family protein [Mucilaginibacter lappiensis]